MEFAKDHDLSTDEIKNLMQRDIEWEQEWARKNFLTLKMRIKRFWDRGIISSLKAHYNRIIGRKLKSRWK